MTPNSRCLHFALGGSLNKQKVIYHILTCLLQVLETTLRDVYRTLKLVLVSEKDPGVLLHVRLSLEELDTTMRALLFPPQDLTKRIRVLDLE